MPDFPSLLNISNKHALIIGGGPVALRRAKALLESAAHVTLVAPNIEPELADLPITTHQRPFEESDLDLHSFVLVIIATDSCDTNNAAQAAANKRNILVNRVDAPEQSDFTVPAHKHLGHLSISVHTSGVSAYASRTIRDQILETLDMDWITILEIASPYRNMIQSSFKDPQMRQDKLKQLTNSDAVMIYKTQGLQAFEDHCQSLIPKTNH
ncbi:precorrin-2 dehydrogenase/sirohydrochlorin ferrochelatase family protein [Poriferisphaera sp. WC338]|uniref:precorrin-2 dehydrogenase/sirohydrochlorin ferrochelatase family protein n=1 Tax=Poriferisphaera sp. WC338 TaxID=3425129 RepID=UPI003D812B91